jgi:hypothetical protein
MMCRKVIWGIPLVIAILLLPFVCAPLLARVDACRLAAHHPPAFCWSHWIGRDWEMLDGGSMIYRGFGYEITAKHKILDSDSSKYDSGVAVAFCLPFYKRYNSETTVESVQ